MEKGGHSPLSIPLLQTFLIITQTQEHQDVIPLPRATLCQCQVTLIMHFSHIKHPASDSHCPKCIHKHFKDFQR